MLKRLFLGLLCCALTPANVNSNIVNEEKRAIQRDTGSEVNVVTMYDNDKVVYSDSSYIWDYCFEQMKAKHKEITQGGGLHSFRCVIEMVKDEFVDRLDNASYLPMPIEINMHGNTITLNYGDYWNIDHGLTINGEGGTIKTTRSNNDYNCSIYVNGGHLDIKGTHFENFNTNMKYPLFTTGNNLTIADFHDCTFTNCSSSTYGGVICMERTHVARIMQCTFENCHAKYGGAVYLEDILAEEYGDDHTLLCYNSNFFSCKATHSGGAMYFLNTKSSDGVHFSLTNCQYEKCEALYYGGAIYMDCYMAYLTLLSSRIKECKARSYGGGIYCHDARPTIFYGEICYCESAYGGGIYLNRTYPTLDRILIHDCRADKDGGGVYIQHGINYDWHDGGAYIGNCNFYNNSPSNANATLMSNGSLTILFGVLSGVFLITTGVFVYLYFRKRKQEKLESNN